jgi:hypothetical protein
MWAYGKATVHTSSAPRSIARASPTPAAISVPSVWRAPLGFAVVPEV